jgi:hypothetical protein
MIRLILAIFFLNAAGALAAESLTSHPGSAPRPVQAPAGDLDKEFYNDYLDSLPNERQQRRETLERNLLTAVQRVIPREDPFEGQAFAAGLTAQALRYERVSVASPFIRGLFAELPYLKETEYMWIVRAGAYLVFVSYRADPERFILGEHQSRVVKKIVPPEDAGHSADGS